MRPSHTSHPNAHSSLKWYNLAPSIPGDNHLAITAEEFKALLQHQADSQILDTVLRDDQIPFVFNTAPKLWDSFRRTIATTLTVSEADIRIVGSGRLGFSMKPGLNLRSFRDTSDIDVIIVNHALFDGLWSALLKAAYPRPPHTSTIGGWLERRRNELYTGWLTPLEIKLDIKIFGNKARPVHEMNAQWFKALKEASRHPPKRHEDISGRLYRTWDHAELYHLHSLAELRKTL